MSNPPQWWSWVRLLEVYYAKQLSRCCPVINSLRKNIESRPALLNPVFEFCFFKYCVPEPFVAKRSTASKGWIHPVHFRCFLMVQQKNGWSSHEWRFALLHCYSAVPQGLEGKAAQPFSLKVNKGYLYISAGFSLPLARDQPVLYLEHAILPAFKTGGATKHPGHQAAFHTGCFIYLRGKGETRCKCFPKRFSILGEKKNQFNKSKISI